MLIWPAKTSSVARCPVSAGLSVGAPQEQAVVETDLGAVSRAESALKRLPGNLRSSVARHQILTSRSACHGSCSLPVAMMSAQERKVWKSKAIRRSRGLTVAGGRVTAPIHSVARHRL